MIYYIVTLFGRKSQARERHKSTVILMAPGEMHVIAAWLTLMLTSWTRTMRRDKKGMTDSCAICARDGFAYLYFDNVVIRQ